MAMTRMLAKLSTRRYSAGLEPVGTEVEASASSTSKSAVSRRFVTATETALADLLGADLSEVDLVALMIDGVHFGEHLCVVALGIGIDGTKHPLAVVEGSTGERHRGRRSAGGVTGPGLGRDPADPGGDRRGQSSGGGCSGGIRPSDHRPVPTPQS